MKKGQRFPMLRTGVSAILLMTICVRPIHGQGNAIFLRQALGRTPVRSANRSVSSSASVRVPAVEVVPIHFRMPSEDQTGFAAAESRSR